MSELHRYEGEGLTVLYDVRRCIHDAACLRGLPAVFDTSNRPWVQPDAADPDAVRATVERCPSGALRWVANEDSATGDGPACETTPARAIVSLEEHGPLVVHGHLRLRGSSTDTDAERSEARVTLCRCGATRNAPYCDGSHGRSDFEAPAGIDPESAAAALRPVRDEAALHLTLRPRTDGPLVVDGAFDLCDADALDDAVARGGNAAFCRCGASANKPFCDGSHREVGFQSTASWPDRVFPEASDPEPPRRATTTREAATDPVEPSDTSSR